MNPTFLKPKREGRRCSHRYLGCALVLLTGMLSGWAQRVDWDASFGGTGTDGARVVRQTLDGGYLLAGYSNSTTNGNKTAPAFGAYDYWIVRTDERGNKLWDRSFGGSTNDILYDAAVTSDGGFILGGVSVSSADGNKTSPHRGGSDYWVVRTDANGTKIWEATYGGSENDELRQVAQTPDGGFFLAGWSFSGAEGNKTATNAGGSDFWVVRLNASGQKLWDRTFGGPGDEKDSVFAVLGDGGFVLGSSLNARVFRADAEGNVIWDHTLVHSFYAPGPLQLTAFEELPDGEVLVSGIVQYDTCGGAPCPFYDGFIARLDGGGNKITEAQLYRLGSLVSWLKAVRISDQGYLVGVGPIPYLTIRVNNIGRELWRHSFSGTGGFDFGSALMRNRDGAHIFSGRSGSQPGGDKTSPNFGGYDMWVLQISEVPASLTLQSLSPEGGRIEADPLPGPDGVYDRETVVTLRAVPSPDFQFAGWGGALSGTNNPLQLTMNQVYTVTANFMRNILTLQPSPSYGGVIEADPPPNAIGEYPLGVIVTLRPMAQPGFAFTGWTGALSGTNFPVQIVMDRFRTVGANFIRTTPPRLAVIANAYAINLTNRLPFTLSLIVSNAGGGVLQYGVASSEPWLIPCCSGTITETGTLSVYVEAAFLTNGINTLAITAYDRTSNSPSVTVPVRFVVLSSVPQVQWKSDGFPALDYFNSLEEADGGGFLAGGHAYGSFGVPFDGWIARLDSRGRGIWRRPLRASRDDSIVATHQWNGGFLAGGFSDSPRLAATNSIKFSTNYGGADFWVVALNGDGRYVEDLSFGGSGNDYLRALVLTDDGGYLAAGSSVSGATGSKTSESFGGNDYWVVRADEQHQERWQRSFGGSQNDVLTAAIRTADGGFLLGGSSASLPDGNKTSPNFGASDFWVVRLDAAGNTLWERTFGGPGEDTLADLQPTGDGGVLLAGSSRSAVGGNKTSAGWGGWDYWVVRLDAGGTKLWERSYGGDNEDTLQRIAVGVDGGFLLSGESRSGISGNKTQGNLAPVDLWLVRLDPAGNQLWEMVYSERISILSKDLTYAGPLLTTADGGFVVAARNINGTLFLKLAPESPQFLPTTGAGPIRLRTPTAGDYAVDRSFDLISWLPWQTNRATGYELRLTDPEADLLHSRFYRARRLR